MMGSMDSPRTAGALEYVRHVAVSLVEAGREPDEVAEAIGVSERSVWRWLSAWRSGGDAGLAPKPGRGRPTKLTAAVLERVLGWVDRSPRELGFPTERWTARRVALLLERELGLLVNRRYLSRWLRARDVTPQVPRRVPGERDDDAVSAWVRHRWPRVKKRSWTGAPPSDSPTRAGSC